jgi:hypothetical protein
MFTGLILVTFMRPVGPIPTPMPSAPFGSTIAGTLTKEDEEFYRFICITIISTPIESGVLEDVMITGYDPYIIMKFAKIVCEKEEIQDPSETYFSSIFSLRDDLKTMRNRYQELLGVPKSVSFPLIPHIDSLREKLAFSNEFQINIKNRMLFETDRLDVYKEILDDCDWRYNAYSCLANAAETGYNVVMRRRGLAGYIQKVGIDDFYNCKLPDIVNFSLFSEP